MTQIADVIQKAMVVIDDVRLTQQLAQNPAVFYSRMLGFVDMAIPMLSSPPELYTYITENYVAPQIADSAWISTTESTIQSIDVDTGIIGYDLCSVSEYKGDNKTVTPYEGAEYDPETGIVTFPVQPQEGIIYYMDFYKDGSCNDLTPQMVRLFALAIAVMWNERLDNDWLSVHPKIQDSAFKTVNEANYVDKMTYRNRRKQQEFTDELKKFEQTVTYQNIVNHNPTF